MVHCTRAHHTSVNRRQPSKRRRPQQIVLLGLVVIAFAALIGGAGFVWLKSTRTGTPRDETSRGNPSPAQPADIQRVPEVGQPFPDFTVTDIDGRVVSRESLQGKPVLIWFTTSYCVPCQVGATQVAKLDDELGGGAFQVLVIFVDPQDPPSALRAWRDQFGRNDWLMAFDTNLARTVQLRALDTKYLLDDKGVLQNVDVKIADDGYLRVIRSVVEGTV